MEQPSNASLMIVIKTEPEDPERALDAKRSKKRRLDDRVGEVSGAATETEVILTESSERLGHSVTIGTQSDADLACAERESRHEWVLHHITSSRYPYFLEHDRGRPESRLNIILNRVAKVVGIILRMTGRNGDNYDEEIGHVLMNCSHLLEPCARSMRYCAKLLLPSTICYFLADAVTYIEWVMHFSYNRSAAALSAFAQWRSVLNFIKREFKYQVYLKSD